MANPYSGGGVATTGGGQGNWDDTTEIINDYVIPTSTALSGGFVNCYLLSDADMLTIRKKFWDVWESIRNYFTKADEAIIATYRLPINPANIVTIGHPISLGGDDVYGTSAGIPVSQFYQIDFGSCVIDKYSDSFLDYNNNTQVTLYLPYVGNVDLDTNIVMGSTLNVKYVIDLFTGNLEAQVYVDGSLTYTYQGNCAYNIPISSINYAQTIESAIRTAVTSAISIASML